MKPYKKMINIHDYKGTFGAAIGDLYGSHYEFEHGPKTPKEGIRLHDDSTFTDDTVLTAAIADYIAHRGEGASIVDYLQKWARKYPHAGYGGRFAAWIYSSDPKPYNSCGNGSAMRISAAAYAEKDPMELSHLVDDVTLVTHNHPEGIKGAYVIATCIRMAYDGASRKQIQEFAEQYYDLNLDYDQMVSYLGHGQEICQITVPQALWCFLHSDSFDDCLRLCLHIRWDADTLAAIACPIAEAYYKEIPEEYLLAAKARLPKDIIEALESVKKE